MKKALLALGLVGVMAASVAGLAGAGQNPLMSLGEREDTDTSYTELKFHRDASIAQPRAKRGTKIGYFVSDPQTVPAGGTVAFTGRCPGNGRVVDGGFNSDGYVYAEQLTFLNNKQYGYRVRDTIGVAGTAIFSLICIK